MTVAFDESLAAETRSIVDLMDSTLEKLRNVYAQAAISLPERQYWTMQQPVADCEQAVVSFIQAFYGAPGDQASGPVRCDGPRSAAMTIQVVRCVPVSKGVRPPDPAKIQEASATLSLDAWLLLDAAGDIGNWDPYGGPGLGVIATVDADQWNGGFGSVTLSLTVAIP